MITLGELLDTGIWETLKAQTLHDLFGLSVTCALMWLVCYVIYKVIRT
jgi:hypothetical protein